MAATAPLDLDALSEREVVLLAQRGDREACDWLASRYRGPAFRLAMQLLGRPDEAMDVAQDAMLRFFGSLERFQADRPVLPWLFRIVHNRVRDVKRRRRRRRVESLDSYLEETGYEPVSERPSPERRARQRALQRRIWKALGNLPQHQRDILVLREYHDMSYAEIATVLDIPQGTVMSRLHSARRRLRQALEANAVIETGTRVGGARGES